MRAVVQRAKHASVKVEDAIVGEIGPGLVVLLGVNEEDSAEDAIYMAEKIVHLRIFEDAEEKLNLSLQDIKGEVLAISQFTIYGDCRKGRRPNFMAAARPEQVNELYEIFVEECRKKGVNVATGVFQAYMQVELINDGPVTIIVDSQKLI